MEQITVSIPPETAEWLRNEAQRLERSQSFIIRRSVEMLRKSGCVFDTDLRVPESAA